MTPPHEMALLAGLALTAALVAGHLARAVGLPRLTGYLAAGVLLGPSALGAIGAEQAADLWPVAEIAIAFIALYAGLEMKIDVLRGRVGTIASIAVGATACVFALVMGTKLALGASLPVLGELSGSELWLAAALVAAVCVTMSPMVTIAAISEQRARGPVTATLLGTTVVVDLVAIVLFAMLIAASAAVWGAGTGGSPIVAATWKIGGSLGLGAALGLILGTFARRDRGIAILAAAAPLAVWGVAGGAGTDLILTGLSAGVVAGNMSAADAGKRFDDAVHRIAGPFFAVFFSLAGAKIDLGTFAAVWHISVLLVVVRVAGLAGGAWLGSSIAGSPGPVRRYAWLGFVSQAGISFAMAAIVGQTIPGGAVIEAALVGMIVLHELVGPVATAAALRLSGERGARELGDAALETA